MPTSEYLKLENQLCFSLYRLSKLVTQGYKEFLDDLDLTYPQYLVMMVLWEHKKTNMTNLGEKLSLDNGTLTPLIKRLIDKGFVQKKRCDNDERIVYIQITQVGIDLKERALSIPEKISCKTQLAQNDYIELKTIVDKFYKKIKEEE